MKFTQKQMEQKYLKGKGLRCPFCDSDNLDGGSLKSDEVISQSITCLACDKEWIEEYTEPKPKPFTTVNELTTSYAAKNSWDIQTRYLHLLKYVEGLVLGGIITLDDMDGFFCGVMPGTFEGE